MRESLALIVDDDQNFAHSLELLVKREGFQTHVASTLAEAQECVKASQPDVILLDVGLPDGGGLEFLREEKDTIRGQVIVVTGQASVDTAVEALREGVLDFLVKPIDAKRLKTTLSNVTRRKSQPKTAQPGAERANATIGPESLDGPNERGFASIVGLSPPMQQVYRLVEKVAPTDATVLITGESGTGKELVAQTIHRMSARRDAVLLPVNGGAISPNLIESELFGHERGSFTGADRLRKGYFERATGGSLFLDEVTEMPFDLQVKLLRVLETGTIMRVGGNEPIQVNVRMIAATNRDPLDAVRQGKLREDLFHRLNTFPINLPPLRERNGDLELLAQHFLDQLNRDSNENKTWTPGALENLRSHRLGGNVRELRNLVQRAFILATGEIGPDCVPTGDTMTDISSPSVLEVKVGSSIAETGERLILATLKQCDGNKAKAAEILGISLKTLYNRLNVYTASQSKE